MCAAALPACVVAILCGYDEGWVRSNPNSRRPSNNGPKFDLGRLISTIMMTPQVHSVRRMPSVAVVVAIAGLTGALAGALTTWMMMRPMPSPQLECALAVSPMIPTSPRIAANPTIVAHVSQRSRTIDEMSPTTFGQDGSPDDVFDLVVDSSIPIKHIFVVREDQGLQWDTVDGDTPIPYGRTFSGRAGGVTWHLGVRERGQWLNAPTSELGQISAGHHELELVATAPQGEGPRVVAVLFTDGTLREVTLGAPEPRRYQVQGGGSRY